jgi:conjugal transfer ATP-binding protein TraC
VLELERLKAMPDLFNVVIMVVVNAVTQELYLSARDRPASCCATKPRSS